MGDILFGIGVAITIVILCIGFGILLFMITDSDSTIAKVILIVLGIIVAAGYKDLERARKEREEFDEPKEWKIVKKKITIPLEVIVDE